MFVGNHFVAHGKYLSVIASYATIESGVFQQPLTWTHGQKVKASHGNGTECEKQVMEMGGVALAIWDVAYIKL